MGFDAQRRLGGILGDAGVCAKGPRFLVVVLPDLYHQQHDDALAVRPAGLAAVGIFGPGACGGCHPCQCGDLDAGELGPAGQPIPASVVDDLRTEWGTPLSINTSFLVIAPDPDKVDRSGCGLTIYRENIYAQQ